jgi:hypothetical protein
MTNCNPQTGIRYGVIAFNSLASWAYDDLWYGPNARDLTYEDALEELKADAQKAYGDYLEQAETAAAEADPGMSSEDRAKFVETWFDDNNIAFDEEVFVEIYRDQYRDRIEIDEPVIEGEVDGVKYRISWLGGAPLLWVFEGPLGVANRLCSPCVPGAADLDGGFTLADEMAAGEDYSRMHECYCVPRSWLSSNL